MKYLKTLILVAVAMFTFGAANAQIRVVVGGHPHHYRHRRVIVVHHRYHRPHRRY